MYKRGSVYFLFLSLFFVLLEKNCFSQTEVKNYIPPSPNAMTFLKYGDYPVDYSTGLPSINIPFYTISYSDYSFPISASFHASGRTTSLNFSPLGMNWALNACGMITREIKGKPDGLYGHAEKLAADYQPQYQHKEELLNLENPRLYGVTGTEMDPEYDIYSISINGISAKFIIRDNVGVVFLTFFPYELEKTNSNYFTLVDDKGITYRFGTETGGLGFIEVATGIGQNSWFISSIVTPTGHQISFKYGSKSTVNNAGFLGTYTYADQITIGDWPNYDQVNGAVSGFQSAYNTAATLKRTNTEGGENYYLSYISEIDFDNGKVLFTYNSTNLLLQEVKVLSDPESQVIKDVFFNFYAYLPGTNLSLANNNSKTIQDIIFKDNQGTEIEKYSFEYYPGTTGSDQPSFSMSKDWWGYYNGQNNHQAGTNAIPVSSIYINTNGPGGIYSQSLWGSPNQRFASENAKKIGMIKKINYPTGGSSEFFYENNKYSKDNVATDGPGLRIQQIKSYDGLGNEISKTYRYGSTANGVTYDGMGYLMWSPSGSDFYTTKIENYINVAGGQNPIWQRDYSFYRWRVFSSEPVFPDVAQALHQPVYYTQVTEFSSSPTNLSANGKTVYTYTYPSSSSPYSTVTAYETYYMKGFKYDTWSIPMLQSKSISKWDAVSSTYKLQSYVYTNYVKYNEVNIPQSNLYRFHDFPYDNSSGTMYAQTFVMTTPPSSSTVSYQVFYLLDKPIIAAVMKPDYETTTTYDDNGNTLQSKVIYKYNNLSHLYPTSIVTEKTSDNKMSTTYISYSGSDPSEKVVTQSDISGANTKIISGEIFNYITNGIPSQASKIETNAPVPYTSFKFRDRDLGVLPEPGAPSGASSAIDSRYKTAINYSLYDSKKNPLQIDLVSNITTSYLWDYRQMYPIAQVKNAPNSQIAQTSFEADGTGNWNAYTGTITTPLVSPYPITGKKYYNLTSTATLSKTVTNGQKYIVSYWRLNSTTAYTINGGTGTAKQGLTIGSWTYFEHLVTATSTTLTITGTGGIDEVRLYPAAAQMTSYTYEPLVGMTSSCDINNRITYYEYDNFQRLLRIKDQDGNILKVYDYKYQQTQ